MKKTLFVFFLAMTMSFGQSVIWSYHATSTLWAHFRATRTIEDVDGDAHDDVIAISENDTLYCFSGATGAPVWRFAADPCYVERGLISVSDLDGDTIADVVVGTIWGTRSVFAISGADGSVIWQYDTHEYGDGGWIYEVAAMDDVTGDSVPEILATAGGPDAERTYLFNGATGAKIWEDYVGYACYGVRPIGDITGDTVTDVAVSTGNYVPDAYRVRFLNGSNGSLVRQVMLPAAGLTVVLVGDINSDTMPDVVCGTGNGTILAISSADGSTLWTASMGSMVWDLNLLPDIDNNGFPELLPSGSGMYSIACIDAVTGSTHWSTPATDQVFVSVAIPDINEDGMPDVLAGTGYTSNYLYALDGGSGAIIWQYPTQSPVESGYWIEDVNGNNIPDILCGLRDGWFYCMSDGYTGISDLGVEPCYALAPGRFGTIEVRHSIPFGNAVELRVYSILGQKKMDLETRIASNPLRVDTGDLPSGVYFMTLRADGIDARFKFVIFE